MGEDELRIVTLADAPALLPTVARWHWDEWGAGDPGGSLATWTEGLRRRAQRDRPPVTWLALRGEEPVGSIALLERDMATHPELSPWLATLFVVPGQRGRGVAGALVAHCEAAATALGFADLFLYTDAAEGYYARRGWSTLHREPYAGADKAVMAKKLTPRA